MLLAIHRNKQELDLEDASRKPYSGPTRAPAKGGGGIYIVLTPQNLGWPLPTLASTDIKVFTVLWHRLSETQSALLTWASLLLPCKFNLNTSSPYQYLTAIA